MCYFVSRSSEITTVSRIAGSMPCQEGQEEGLVDFFAVQRIVFSIFTFSAIMATCRTSPCCFIRSLITIPLTAKVGISALLAVTLAIRGIGFTMAMHANGRVQGIGFGREMEIW